MHRDFVLDIATERHQKLFQTIRDRKDELDIFFDDEERQYIVWSLVVKKPGTCFDKPVVPWKQVREGDRLWAEYSPSMLSFSRDWYPIRITKKYGGVIFYRWLDGPKKGELDHAEDESLFATKMVYPYVIRLPKDVRVSQCFNNKQLYEYV